MAIEIARTYDADFITLCVTHPKVWDKISDDGAPVQDLFFPPMDGVIWLRAEDYGVFALHKLNHVTGEAHTILLPEAHGMAVEIAREALKFAFAHCDVKRIVTNVPSFNIPALKLAHRAGFKDIGINSQSFQKNGVLYDQHFLGISEGDLSCQS